MFVLKNVAQHVVREKEIGGGGGVKPWDLFFESHVTQHVITEKF